MVRGDGSTRDRVAILHEQRPDLSMSDIARELGVSRQRTAQIADELGILKPRKRPTSVDAPNVPMMTAADVTNWRAKHNVTLATLADMVGTTKDTVSRWERGISVAPKMLAVALWYWELTLEK